MNSSSSIAVIEQLSSSLVPSDLSSSLASISPIAEEITSYPVARTAKDILGLTDMRMNYIEGNVDPDIDPTNRGPDDFAANRIEYPGGEPFTPFWDSSR